MVFYFLNGAHIAQLFCKETLELAIFCMNAVHII